MSTKENVALDRRVAEKVWNEGDMDVADQVFASDVVLHGAAPGLPPGVEGVKAAVTAYRAAFPDLHVTNDDYVAEGDRVASRWSWQGTHKGELFGIPATGKQVTMTGISIMRVVDGKIAEVWSSSDQLSLMQQIGAAPTPGQN